MADLPLTTTLLLDRLRRTWEGGESAWAEIDARYRPVLIGFTRSLGLSEADAEDAAQWTLAEFSRGLRGGQYERGKGRLRSWVMGIARHRVEMIRRSVGRRPENKKVGGSGGVSPIEERETPDAEGMEAIWDREVERAVFEEAWRRVQGRFAPESLRAFELVAMRGASSAAAAAECGMNFEALYMAKSRVTKALREIAADLTRRYGDDE
ncbi:MAG: sigma-70 family RNA polymerase sigma factor [Phycisphaeraceae bacterium]|nr:MAG: sigma-70 family RNA polymerase sigma factor [Phycisphaeraceae bacterium]